MLYEDTYLAHHGIKGQRWGIRRFQNTDGTLTPEGKNKYLIGNNLYTTHNNYKRITNVKSLLNMPQNRREERQQKKFVELVNKSNHYGKASEKAKRKLLKNSRMKALLNDEEIKQKEDAYKKAKKDLFELSKGEDYDAYDPKTNNYGISKKQFKSIQTAANKKKKAYDDLEETVRKKTASFLGDHATQPVKDIKLGKAKYDDDLSRWLKVVTMVELNRRSKKT